MHFLCSYPRHRGYHYGLSIPITIHSNTDFTKVTTALSKCLFRDIHRVSLNSLQAVLLYIYICKAYMIYH